MAGKRGMKGGGGARPGAGAKKRKPDVLDVVPPVPPADTPAAIVYDDPERFLTDVMNNATADARLRVDAAKALMPYLHQKKGENGKKGERKAAAGKASLGKFAPAAPPRLVHSR